MSREYQHIEGIANEILTMRAAGKTRREIWEYFGLSKKQYENFLNRHNRKQRELEHGIVPRKRGRPRKNGAIEAENAGREIKRLRMENELLRDFLHECGRGRGQKQNTK